MKKTIEKMLSSLGLPLIGKLTPEQQVKLSEKLPVDIVTAYCQSDGSKISLNEALANTQTFKDAVVQASKQAVDEVNEIADNQTIANLMAEKQSLQSNLESSQKQLATMAAAPAKDIVTVEVPDVNMSGDLGIITSSHSHNIVATSILNGTSASVEFSNLNVDELKTEFGKVTKLNVVIPIHQQIYNGFTSAKHFTPVYCIAIYESATLIAGNLIKRYKKDTEFSTGFKLIPNKIENKHHKVDVKICPVEIVNSWISGLYTEGKSPAQSPLVNYIYKEVILPKMQDEIELLMVYKGEFILDNTDTDHAMDGIETILIRASKDTETRMHINKSEFNMQTATHQQVLDYFSAFSKKIPAKMKPFIKEAYCSAEMRERYLEAQKYVHNTGGGTDNIDFGKAKLPYSHIQLVAVAGMYDSPIIYCTVSKNQLILFNKMDHKTFVADIQVVGREVLMLLDFWLAVGFAVDDFVVANVPSNYVLHPVAPVAPVDPVSSGTEAQGGIDV